MGVDAMMTGVGMMITSVGGAYACGCVGSIMDVVMMTTGVDAMRMGVCDDDAGVGIMVMCVAVMTTVVVWT